MSESERNNVRALDVGKTDAALAEEYRRDMAPILEQVVDIFNRCKLNGLTPAFNIGLDEYGRYRVTTMNIVRPL